MNEVRKPRETVLFFYYIIVLMAILLLNSLAMPMITENKIKESGLRYIHKHDGIRQGKSCKYRSSRTRSCSLVKKMTRYTRPPW